MTYNRLLEFRVVRSTRAVVWTPARMVEDQEHSMKRTPEHLATHGDEEYPDPGYYLNFQGKYLFRALGNISLPYAPLVLANSECAFFEATTP